MCSGTCIHTGSPCALYVFSFSGTTFIAAYGRRQEPGDTFIMDLVPGFHTDVSLPSDTRPSFDGARILRLRDFASLYGTVFGNMQMRRTGLWLVWDLAQMHQDVRSRVQESGKELVYGTGTNGRKLSPAGLNTRGRSPCSGPSRKLLLMGCFTA